MRRINLYLLSLTILFNGCSLRSGLYGGSEGGVSAIGLTPGEWVQLSKAGPAHKLLSGLIGHWSVEVEFWSAADTKGEVSSGRSESEWILGERFIQEKFKGSIGGEEYTGLGILGYDNGARRFRSVWMDSLNTALTTATGRYLADTHSFEFESLIYDPLIGGERSVRSYITFKGADRYTVTMLTRDTEGREFKSLEMRYQRLGS